MDALGKLSGGIAHDYNNLLGIIIGYAELIMQFTNEENLHEYATQIFEAGNRGSRLTKKLLAFTREQANVSEIVDINELLTSDLNMLQKTLTARINISLELEDNLNPVYLDKGDFQDCVLNISINAMHAMPNGGNYTIKTRNAELGKIEAAAKNISPGHYVRLSFSDTGCGMNEEIKERIFDPFFTTKGSMGSGLGLSQVFGFVKRSDGHIYVYSEPEKGTTISIYFKQHESQKQNILISEADYEDVAGHNQTVLVVDDEPSLRALATDILDSAGYKTFEADSGAHALKILESFKIDLLLSDVIMPEMDGYELARTVKQRFPETKILLASGFSNNTTVDDLRDLAEKLLNKPYTSKDLLRAVKSALSN
jgi:CheY-like chemotaxis protein